MFAVDGLSGRYLYNVMRGGAGAEACCGSGGGASQKKKAGGEGAGDVKKNTSVRRRLGASRGENHDAKEE